MLTQEELRKKVFELPDLFKIHMQNKKWWRAKHCYDTAVLISVFAEMSEDDKKALFGTKAYMEEREEPKEGLFQEDEVNRAYIECIRLNQTREREDHRPGRKK